MQVTKHYFPVTLFTKLYKVILNEILCDHLDESYWAVLSWSAVNYTVESGWLYVWVCGCLIVQYNHWKQLKATNSNLAALWFIVLCRVVLILQSVDETLKCDNSNESFWAAVSCGAVYYADDSNFFVCGWNYPKVLKCKLSTTFWWDCLQSYTR